MDQATATSSVPAGIEQARQWQEELYRFKHAKPELTHQEEHTAVAGQPPDGT